MSKGGGGGTQQVIQKADPPKYLLPYLTQSTKAAADLYAKGPAPLYAGPTYAPINSTQQQALDQTLAYGKSGASPYATDALNTLDASATSDPSQGNPYLDKLLQNYGDKANQMVASNFNSAGRYGSGAHAGAAGDAIAKATLPILSQQYNTDMTNKLSSAALLPSLANQADQQTLSKAKAVGSVGDIYSGQDQNAINDAITRFQYEHGGGENTALNNFISQINSLPNSGGTSSSSTKSGTTQGVGGTIGNIVGGLGALGGLGTGIGSFLGAAGGFGMADSLASVPFLGNAAWAAALASDERLKENIEHVGIENGHNVYEFNYKTSPTRYVGVMAQEVLKKNPAAVFTDKSGYMKVNYDIIGVKFREAAPSGARRAAAPSSVGGHVEAGAAGCASQGGQ